MNLPEKIQMQSTCFIDGRNGYAGQTYVNEEFGITCTAERENRRAPFIETWMIKSIPDKTFKSYKELREAINNTKKEGT